MSVSTGKITQIIGPVVDVSFDSENAVLPAILDAHEVTKSNGDKVILETQTHIGEDTLYERLLWIHTEGLK